MSLSASCERKLTQLDFRRLERLRANFPGVPLSDVLDDADVVPSPAIPPDVITMYSRFEIEDIATGRHQTLVLCYPPDASPATGTISVLSPAGLGLLGASVGSIARWQLPCGEECSARVLAIHFQPEATGDYTT